MTVCCILLFDCSLMSFVFRFFSPSLSLVRHYACNLCLRMIYVMRLLGLIGKHKKKKKSFCRISVCRKVLLQYQSGLSKLRWERTRPPCFWFSFSISCVSGEWTGFDITFRVHGYPLCVFYFIFLHQQYWLFSFTQIGTSYWISQDNEIHKTKQLRRATVFLF